MTQLEELLASRRTLKAFESKAPGGGAQGQTTALTPETQRGVASVSVTGSQTGTDSQGHTPELDYPRLQFDAVNAFQRAHLAGQMQRERGALDEPQAHQFAAEYVARYAGPELTEAGQVYMFRRYMSGFRGED
jgi:hypothetical protein